MARVVRSHLLWLFLWAGFENIYCTRPCKQNKENSLVWAFGRVFFVKLLSAFYVSPMFNVTWSKYLGDFSFAQGCQQKWWLKQGQGISCERISAGESYSSQHRKVKVIQFPFSIMLIKSVVTGFPWRVFQVLALLFHFWCSHFFIFLISRKHPLLSNLW